MKELLMLILILSFTISMNILGYDLITNYHIYNSLINIKIILIGIYLIGLLMTILTNILFISNLYKIYNK